jgi:hypothetical protein
MQIEYTNWGTIKQFYMWNITTTIKKIVYHLDMWEKIMYCKIDRYYCRRRWLLVCVDNKIKNIRNYDSKVHLITQAVSIDYENVKKMYTKGSMYLQ